MIYMLNALTSVERKLNNMLGLVLTLFISMFSSCPIVNSIDQRENNILILDNTTQKRDSWKFGYNYILSSTEFCATLNYWEDLATRRFGANLFSDGAPYFASGSSIYEEYIDNDYILDLRWVDIDTFIRGGTSPGYPYKNITRLRFSYTRVAGNVFSTKKVHFSIQDLGDRYIEFRVYDNDVANSGVPVMDGDMYNSYYFASTNFIYDEGFIYGDNSVFYSIWGTGNSKDYQNGYDYGYSIGYENGKTNGYQSGYNTALDDMSEQSSTALTIFTGILDVGLLPVNVFLQILNFEVFGINISGLVSGFLTIAIFIIVIRMIFGGKKDD